MKERKATSKYLLVNILQIYLHENIFVTSIKEVMFSPGFVCMFVCALVNKITQKLGQISMKFSGYV